MKYAGVIVALATLASAEERMLDADDRRLFGGLGGKCKDPENREACKTEYYRSIYYRCCGSLDNGEDPGKANKGEWRRKRVPKKESGEEKYMKQRCMNGCCCPVRGLEKKGWFSQETFFEKWEAACAPDGSIYTKGKIDEIDPPEVVVAEGRIN